MKDNGWDYKPSKPVEEPYMSPEEKAENAKNFKFNMWLFGSFFVGIIIWACLLKHFHCL